MQAGDTNPYLEETTLNELICCCSINSHQEVSRILKTGFDIKETNEVGQNALLAAAFTNSSPAIIETLLNYEPNILHQDNGGFNCLHFASNAQVLTKLLTFAQQQQLDINDFLNCKNLDGSTPLHEAALHGPYERVKCLLEHGASVNARDLFGATPLHYFMCSIKKPNETLLALLNYGADVNIQNNYKKTPLHVGFSYIHMNENLLSTLLKHRANPELEDMDGNNLLHLYLRGGFVIQTKPSSEIIEQMVQNKPSILNSKNKYNQTPLLFALTNGHFILPEDIVINLMNREQFDLNTRDSFDRNLLHLSCSIGYIELSKELIKNCHSLVIEKDCMGRLPIHYAFVNGNIDLICHLLGEIKLTENRFVKDDFGLVPAQYGTCISDKDIIKLSQQFGITTTTSKQCSNCTKESNMDILLQDIVLASKDNIKPELLRPVENVHQYIQKILTDSKSPVQQPHVFKKTKQQVESFVQSILDLIVQNDQRFSGQWIGSGSSYEGTRTCDGDFDYMILLDQLSDIVVPVESETDPPGFIRVKINNDKIESQNFQEFFEADGFLNCEKLMSAFSSIIMKTIYQPTLWKNKKFDFIPNLEIKWKKRAAFTIKCTLHDNDARTSVEMDIVPIIFLKKWLPRNCTEASLGSLWNVVQRIGCHLVIKPMDRPYYHLSKASMTRYYLRITFQKALTIIFQESNEVVRKSVILAKLLFKRNVKVPLNLITEDVPNTKKAKYVIISKNLLVSFYVKHIVINILKNRRNQEEFDLLQLTQEIFWKYWQCVRQEELVSAFLPGFDILHTYQTESREIGYFINLVLQSIYISLHEKGKLYAIDTDMQCESVRITSSLEVNLHKRMKNLIKCLQGPDEVIMKHNIVIKKM